MSFEVDPKLCFPEKEARYKQEIRKLNFLRGIDAMDYNRAIERECVLEDKYDVALKVIDAAEALSNLIADNGSPAVVEANTILAKALEEHDKTVAFHNGEEGK